MTTLQNGRSGHDLPDRDLPGRAGGAVALVVFLGSWTWLVRHEPVTGVLLGWMPAMFASWGAGLAMTVLLRMRERGIDVARRRADGPDGQRTTHGAEAP